MSPDHPTRRDFIAIGGAAALAAALPRSLRAQAPIRVALVGTAVSTAEPVGAGLACCFRLDSPHCQKSTAPPKQSSANKNQINARQRIMLFPVNGLYHPHKIQRTTGSQPVFRIHERAQRGRRDATVIYGEHTTLEDRQDACPTLMFFVTAHD